MHTNFMLLSTVTIFINFEAREYMNLNIFKLNLNTCNNMYIFINNWNIDFYINVYFFLQFSQIISLLYHFTIRMLNYSNIIEY